MFTVTTLSSALKAQMFPVCNLTGLPQTGLQQECREEQAQCDTARGHPRT